ncbi:pullulanase-type alpha-1,6-glucosidase [Thalassotalea mangrovi]|uniref:Pullulanase-type alpha-1,6-glucosidase n=1 Tax=Thalassotalea mangrovi TaxID=2572245 RepID=A0A4U1B6S3_9GAMM|nr:pullulanase-type alpha-1,6-glucosidase [Thalassotalea mangrovi]TKB46264.1 pullulanase-type alpha-1,6-glucosidase [Thalassotalea mangrovi]
MNIAPTRRFFGKSKSVSIPAFTVTLSLLSGCLAEPDSSLPQLDSQQLITQTQTAQAHWLTSENLLLVAETSLAIETDIYLATSSGTGNLDNLVKLSKRQVDDDLLDNFPHLASFDTLLSYRVDLTNAEIKEFVKGPVYLVSFDEQQQVAFSTAVQFGFLLDELYTRAVNDADEYQQFGATHGIEHGKPYVQFSLWAPTAKSVAVNLYQQADSSAQAQQLQMVEDKNSGIWSARLPGEYHETYYQYTLSTYHPEAGKIVEITTTDPYSLSLSTNSVYSQIIDLNAAKTMPEGWSEHLVPEVENIEDNVFYETHIGDFSAHEKNLSNPAFSGKYKAFTEKNSDGIRHFKELQKAGLNNIHLLPAFDIGTVNEDPDLRVSLADTVAKLCQLKPEHSWCTGEAKLGQERSQETLLSVLQSFDPRSANAQQAVSEWRDIDDYNWGYDPFHYTVPEGSYATDPMGVTRIIEFREMVQSLHQLGFRVIMDVVYNHTHKAGLETTSVLDKIVPNYYQRLNPISGAIEQSTCCDNTATERAMMAKLMVDSLVVWSRDYKIDGFRFDLMGHQPKDLMLEAREAVQVVDPDTYFYGEGWNFGEVANNQRFVQASQLELAGTEIGTFSDRLRDAVRGGAFNASGDDIRKAQGIGNGLGTYGNELTTDSHDQFNNAMDQIRVGLAANLATFPLTNSAGKQVQGKDILYGDQPTGYALDPADTINYVSKHDNQTLWDNNQYRLPYDMSTEDRVRTQILSLAYPLMAQGIPFIHMGSELLRSKAFLRDSYDYGDWFNQVDFSMQTNNYNVGLPPAEKDQQNWSLIGDLLSRNEGRDLVKEKHIRWSKQRFIEYLSIRMSSPLFRLTNAEDIHQRVSFENAGADQQPGIIAMKLSDSIDAGTDLDAKVNDILVIFNNQAEAVNFAYADLAGWQLHPVQQQSDDALIKASRVTKTGFDIGKLTVAVFVR